MGVAQMREPAWQAARRGARIDCFSCLPFPRAASMPRPMETAATPAKPIGREPLLQSIRAASHAGASGRHIGMNGFLASHSLKISDLYRHFSGWRQALRAAGVPTSARNAPVADHALLIDWASVAARIRRIPHMERIQTPAASTRSSTFTRRTSVHGAKSPKLSAPSPPTGPVGKNSSRPSSNPPPNAASARRPCQPRTGAPSSQTRRSISRPPRLRPCHRLRRHAPRPRQRARRHLPIRHARRKAPGFLVEALPTAAFPGLPRQAHHRRRPLAARHHRIRIRKPQLPLPPPLPRRLRCHRLLGAQLERLPARNLSRVIALNEEIQRLAPSITSPTPHPRIAPCIPVSL